MRHCTRTTCYLFSDTAVEAVARREFVRGGGRGGTTAGSAVVVPARDLLGGVDRYGLDGWFDPGGIHPRGIGIRQRFSHSIYPVSMLAHGLSVDQMLHQDYLTILLSGALPCDSLVCTSLASQNAARRILEYVAEEFNAEFGTKLAYLGRLDRIPLCVDTECLRPRERAALRRQMSIPGDAFVMLYVGFLSFIKTDLAPLLRVWRTIVSERPRRRLLFVIAGTGHPGYREWLRVYARSLGLADNVRLLAGISDATKGVLFPAADLFVSPATTVMESFGLAPVEAMACGVPQIVSDWDGHKDSVVHGETGFLIPTLWGSRTEFEGASLIGGWAFDHEWLEQSVALDLRALKAALEAVIDNVDLRGQMAVNSRRRAESMYSQQVVAGQYEELWSELSGTVRHLGRPRVRCRYALPDYWRFFGHYCSTPLRPDAPVRLTDFGRDVAAGRCPIPVNPALTRGGCLEEELLSRLISEMSSAETEPGLEPGQRLPSFAEISLLLANGGRPARVMRHLAWLLKQGIVEPLPERCCTSDGEGHATAAGA